VDEGWELLDRGLAEIGFSTSDAQRAALLELAALLETWGARLNLSGHRDRASIVRRLILDAAGLTQILPEAQTIADLGSGAGFPGLPMAILRPGSLVTLVEARERRHYFQRAAIRVLDLRNVESVRGRMEALPASPHELVVAQALARPSRALELMRPWAAPGGWLAIPSSAATPRIAPEIGIKPLETLRYSVPCGGPQRSVWLGQRAAGT